MKKLKAYVVYLKTGDNSVDVLNIPGASVKDVRNYVKGNGRVIAIEEDPDRMPKVDKVVDAMQNGGCTKTECDIVMRILNMVTDAG